MQRKMIKRNFCVILSILLSIMFVGCSKKNIDVGNDDANEIAKVEDSDQEKKALDTTDKNTDAEQESNEESSYIGESSDMEGIEEEESGLADEGINAEGGEKEESGDTDENTDEEGLSDIDENMNNQLEENSNKEAADSEGKEQKVLYISFEDGEEKIYSLSQPDKSTYEIVENDGVTDGNKALKLIVNSLNKVEYDVYSELVIDSGSEAWDFGDGTLKIDVYNPENYPNQIRVIITDGAGTTGTYYFSINNNESRMIEISQFEKQEDNFSGPDGYWGLKESGLDKTRIKTIKICLWEGHPSLSDDSIKTSSFIVDNIRVD